MPEPGLLRFTETARQREVLEALFAHGCNQTKAAKALGIARTTIQKHLYRAQKKAARAGYAPDHDFTKEAPPGYMVGQAWTRYGADGDVLRQTVHTKPDKELEKQAYLDAVRELAEPYRGKSKKVKAPKSVEGDLLSVYGWGDMHIGMLAWNDEVGDSFDLQIAQELYQEVCEKAVAVAPCSREALIVAVGDNLHTNSSDWLTPKSKHALDGDSRFQKVLKVGARILRHMVEVALHKHELVTLVVVLGNHDFDSSAGLALALEMYFENNPRVRVDNTPGRFHYYRFGQCFLGITHGDTVKPPKLPLLMASRRPKDWGETKWRKWYTGHLHTEILRDYGGAVVETLATATPKDAYAAEAGYDSYRKTIVDVWHKVRGKLTRHEIGVG